MQPRFGCNSCRAMFHCMIWGLRHGDKRWGFHSKPIKPWCIGSQMAMHDWPRAMLPKKMFSHVGQVTANKTIKQTSPPTHKENNKEKYKKHKEKKKQENKEKKKKNNKEKKKQGKEGQGCFFLICSPEV